ncbi:hypothetical protein ACQZV8_21755, partial [Magnetococcales bacterium HHB-1]
GTHIEPRKGSVAQAIEYCKKDGDFYEHGDCPHQGKRTDLDDVTELIRSGASMKEVAERYPSTFVKYSRGLRDFKLTVTESYQRKEVCGVWLMGEPGSGKSHYAQTHYPDRYNKSQNKWFDGYAGEKVIVLEDLDTGALSHHLKIWSDKWACTGETKGGTVHLMHDVFVVTSNYSIEELVPKKKSGKEEVVDQPMIAALERRFKVYRFNKEFVGPDVGQAGPGHWWSVMTDPNGEKTFLGKIE